MQRWLPCADLNHYRLVKHACRVLTSWLQPLWSKKNKKPKLEAKKSLLHNSTLRNKRLFTSCQGRAMSKVRKLQNRFFKLRNNYFSYQYAAALYKITIPVTITILSTLFTPRVIMFQDYKFICELKIHLYISIYYLGNTQNPPGVQLWNQSFPRE